MAETNGNGAANAVPQITTLSQYIKDLSFENPNAPRSLAPQERQPNIAIQVNVNAQQLAESDFEVTLKLEGSAGEAANVMFKFELDYCGIFRLVNIPQEQVHPVVMIECPRLLFPFVRQIVADAVRNGGFPPLFLDPVDFGALYMQRVAEAQKEQGSGATA
ncbi:MAG: protein-export chaperone SecB [Hyphomicrobiales bacterium]|nr:protein-export chaperone SecB [Hyphomicrobiales bacterium]